MDLAERGGGQRRLVDRDDFLRKRAELLVDDPPDRGERLRRHFVLEPRQLGGELLRQDVDARRQELAHLDQHAAHLHGQPPEAGGNPTKTRGARPLDEPAEAKPGQQPFPDDQSERRAGEEADDAPIARGGGHGRAACRPNRWVLEALAARARRPRLAIINSRRPSD